MNPTWPRAVLFDFDGTLADSYDAIAASVNHVRKLKGFPPLSVPEVKRFVGRGPAFLVQHTIPNPNLDDDLPAYRSHHVGIMKPLTRLLPGAAQALEALQVRGIATGVCSNKPRVFTEELLAHLGVGPLTQVVIGPEDVARPKPAPDMLLAALERLKREPPDALYVGDMALDVATARAAGMTVWIVPTGSDPLDAILAVRPDRVLTSLTEIPSALP